MLAQLEHVVARDLRVVGGEIAGFLTVEVVLCALPVGLDRQMAPAARSGPRKVASEAGHLAVLVRPIRLGHTGTEPEQSIYCARTAHQLGAGSLGVEIGRGRIDRILGQVHLPFQAWIDDRALNQRASAIGLAPFKAAFAVRVAQQGQVVAFGRRGRSRGQQGRIGIGAAVAIDAADFDRIGYLTIDQPVAVTVLCEVAIGALHALFGVDIHQVHRLAGIGPGLHKFAFTAAAPLFRIVWIDQRPLRIEQIARPVAFEHRAEVPAVAVIIGELGVLEFRVEIVDVAQEIDVTPQAARRRRFGVAFVDRPQLRGIGVALVLEQAVVFRIAHPWRARGAVFGARPHQRRVSLIVPHGVA